MVGDARSGEPVAPEPDGRVDACGGVGDVGGSGETVGPGQCAEGPLALGQHVAGAGGAAFDADRQVGAQPQGLPGACGVGGVARAVDQRPRGGFAAVVERRFADQFDLDGSVEALHRPHEEMLGVVVGGRSGVRGDRVRPLSGPHRQGVVDDDPSTGGVPGGGQHMGAGHVGPRGGHIDAEGAEPERARAAVQEVPERTG